MTHAARQERFSLFKRISSLNHGQIFFVFAIFVFLSYANALSNGFVWDDGFLIEENPFIKNFKYFPNLFIGDLVQTTAGYHNESGYYRPLSMFSFMVDYALWNLNPFGYHLTNIFIHLLNSFLVFLLVLNVSRDKITSFFSGLFFAIYPIHVEAVTPIFNRMGILVDFFILWSLWLFIKSDTLRKQGFLAGSLVLLCAALLCKENAVILPLCYIVYDYFYSSDQKISRFFVKRKIVFFGLTFIICAIYFFIRKMNIEKQFLLPFLGNTDVTNHWLAQDMVSHLLTVIKMFGAYVTKVLFPFDLRALYWYDPVNSFSDLRMIFGLVILCSIVLGIFLLRKKNTDVSFFLSVFLVSLIPVSNIIPLGAYYRFQERFLYFPSLVACFLLARLVVFLYDKYYYKRELRLPMNLLFAALVFSYTLFTFDSNKTWRSNLSLWEETVRNNPESQLAHLNLGREYWRSGKKEAAIYHLHRSMNVNRPKADSGLYIAKLNLSAIYINDREYEKARKELEESLQIAKVGKLNPFAAYDKLGIVYVNLNDKKKAEEYFKWAFYRNKNSSHIRYNLGILYLETGDYSNAEIQFEKALELETDNIYYMYSLALVYVRQGRVSKAKKTFEEIIEKNPNFTAARQALEVIREDEKKSTGNY